MERVESIQVLVATMNQNNSELIEKMNIQTDAIIGNQCNKNEVLVEKYKDNKIIWLNFSEKGVGLNRNNALMRAEADILVFADDDMVFYDNYEEIVLEAFNNMPEADVIIFNLEEKYPKRRITTKAQFTKKVGYGAARIACRRKVIQENGIFFNLCYGGGTKHSHGEDTLFLADCVHKGVKLYLVPQTIARLLEDRESTWFVGYTNEYFIDEGMLLAACRMPFTYLKLLKSALINSKKHKKAWKEIFKLYCQGVKKFRRKVY